MNKSNFISAIAQPEQIDLSQVDQLKALVNQFPYCTTAQILLAKGLHNLEDISFEKQLRVSAAYAIDRTVLHHLILERPASKISTYAKGEKTAEIDTEAVVEQPTNDHTDQAEEEVQVSTVMVIKEDEVLEAKKETVEEDKEQEKTDEAVSDPFLEREILSAAIHNTYFLEADEAIEEAENTTTESEDVFIEQDSTPNFDESSEYSFSEWLKLMDSSSASTQPREEKSQEPKKANKELINKFITTDPQIKPKKEFYSASNMARLSVKENDDLVTETLANIYAQQGNIEKAISAYEKLALKYPEKRIYFANLIHKLGESPKK
jgi:tetratricopeptide (TPR) repeat protein